MHPWNSKSHYLLGTTPGDTLLTPPGTAMGIAYWEPHFTILGQCLPARTGYVRDTELRQGAYVRYADDRLVFSNDKAMLHDYRQQISEFLVSLCLVFYQGNTDLPGGDGHSVSRFSSLPDLSPPQVTQPGSFQTSDALFAYWACRWHLEYATIVIEHQWVNGYAHAKHGSTYRLRAVEGATPVCRERTNMV